MKKYYDLFSEEWNVKKYQASKEETRIGRVEFLDTVDMLNERLPGVFEPWVQTRENGGVVTIERYLIKIVGTQFCFLLPYNVRDGLFFFLEKKLYFNNYNEVSDFNNWRSERPYPNYIRTARPSKRQLTEWVEYIKEEERMFIEHVTKCRKEKADFLESIKDYKVYWNPDKSGGEIEKNGINFSFTFDKGEIFTKIKLAYNAGSSLESFKKLSDNKWVKGL